MVRGLVIAGLAAAALFVAAPAAHAEPLISVTCSPGGCAGWHTGPVTIDWTVSATSITGCEDTTLTGDTAGSPQGCIASDVDGTVSRQVNVRIDQTAPFVTGATPARAADGDGWYRQAIGVSFAGGDNTSGIAACSDTSYAGPDGAGVQVTGTCRDNAGNVSPSAAFTLNYDATAPTVTAGQAERRPDKRDWYTAPVAFAFQGADALSGLATCDPVTYGGPDGAGAQVVGTCRDRAGNVGARGFPIAYDASAPALGRVRVIPGDRRVRLRFRRPADAKRMSIVRSPGLRRKARSGMRLRSTRGFSDSRVRNGRRYRYRITVVDAVGNRGSHTVGATPGIRLLRPSARAQVRRPPTLTWTTVRRARYYNVQLFRGGRKVMSAWPTGARLRLHRTWRYRGRKHLTPGTYRWYVWPGRGLRRAHRYGRLVGARTFVVRG